MHKDHCILHLRNIVSLGGNKIRHIASRGDVAENLEAQEGPR